MSKSLRSCKRYQTDVSGELMTKQQFKEQCDINNIMRKYQKTGAIDHFSRYGAQYGEHDGITLHEAMNIVTKAQQMFDDLPSSIRKKFANEPGLFLDFVSDESNKDEMVEMGLIEAPTPYRSADDAGASGQGDQPGKSDAGQQPGDQPGVSDEGDAGKQAKS